MLLISELNMSRVNTVAVAGLSLAGLFSLRSTIKAAGASVVKSLSESIRPLPLGSNTTGSLPETLPSTALAVVETKAPASLRSLCISAAAEISIGLPSMTLVITTSRLASSPGW